MEEDPDPMADGLGSKTIDSHEVRKKQGSVPILQSTPSFVLTPKSKISMASITTPQTYKELCPNLRDTPIEDTVHISRDGEDGNQIQSKLLPDIQTPKIPSFASHVISRGSIIGPDGTFIQSKLLVLGTTYSTPTKFTPFRPIDLYPTNLQPLEPSTRRVQNPIPKNLNSKIP